MKVGAQWSYLVASTRQTNANFTACFITCIVIRPFPINRRKKLIIQPRRSWWQQKEKKSISLRFLSWSHLVCVWCIILEGKTRKRTEIRWNWKVMFVCISIACSVSYSQTKIFKQNALRAEFDNNLSNLSSPWGPEIFEANGKSLSQFFIDSEQEKSSNFGKICTNCLQKKTSSGELATSPPPPTFALPSTASVPPLFSFSY